ncbi:M56 family metallopeptidase [Luteibacter sp. CQ10]|uniref:M56 family metallopeptidase n=1 Tax=Luteibacter sp. CQ10 TaxID=2805821 RepID=UPI0034A448DD
MTALALVVACVCSLVAGTGMVATLACVQDGLSAAARHRCGATAFWLTAMLPVAAAAAHPFVPSTTWDAPHAAIAALLPDALPAQSWLAAVADALSMVVLLLASAGSLRLAIRLRATARLTRRVRTTAGNAVPVLLADVHGPLLLGLRRPMVILPEAARGYPTAVIDALVRHERAHAHRYDNWRLWAESWAIALLPWCWPLHRLHRIVLAAREEICDAVALHGTDDATRTGYGRALVDALRRSARAHAGVSTVAGHREALHRRMAAILDPSPFRPLPWRRRLAALVALALGWVAAASAWSLDTELETLAGLRGMTLRFQSLANGTPDLYRVTTMGGPPASTGRSFTPGTYRVSFERRSNGTWRVVSEPAADD